MPPLCACSRESLAQRRVCRRTARDDRTAAEGSEAERGDVGVPLQDVDSVGVDPGTHQRRSWRTSSHSPVPGLVTPVRMVTLPDGLTRTVDVSKPRTKLPGKSPPSGVTSNPMPTPSIRPAASQRSPAPAATPCNAPWQVASGAPLDSCHCHSAWPPPSKGTLPAG